MCKENEKPRLLEQEVSQVRGLLVLLWVLQVLCWVLFWVL